MSKISNIGLGVVVVIGLAIVLVACGPGGGGSSSRSSQRSVPSQSDAYQTAQRAQQQKDEMVRRVRGIIENIGSAEARLRDTEETIREERKALDEVKESAKTAHLGGQMSDFRMWQRIGKEKKANIERALQKAEKTIAAARQGAESQLQHVNWVSSGEKETHLNQVNQRLSQMEAWTATFSSASEDLAQHDVWLNAND